ncbi:hypothetical protein JKY72_04445 [Candidatus Gracilibacteria bacterium]|nr:hypothetical protein [Candidatus Gracilibacteria bacterium]
MSKEDGIVDLRTGFDSEDAEFRINHFGAEKAVPQAPVHHESQPNAKVRVKFDKFVNLIATHAYEDVFAKYRDEDIVISTDLLTDLANAHDDKPEKKMPVIFIMGICLGVVLTWFLLNN